MRTTAVPYLQPAAESVVHSGWYVVDLAGTTPLPLEMPHWDYQTKLVVSGAISVERSSILAQCELDDASELAVVVTCRSDHTGARGLISRVPVPRQERYDLALNFDLPGHSLGGRLDIDTLLVATLPIAINQMAPHRPASILWRTRHRSHLEGSGARFPTDSADFRETRPSEARAGWHLHVDLGDPQTSFMTAVRLTLNTANPAIERMLEGATGSDVELLVRAIRWDVTRQLVAHALSCDDVEDGPADFESSQAAMVLRSLLAQIWPLDEPSALRQRLVDNPELIELQIQHHAGFPH